MHKAAGHQDGQRRRDSRGGGQRLRDRQESWGRPVVLLPAQQRDLLAQVHVTAAAPPAAQGAAPAVSAASLKADLVNCQDRCTRLTARVRILEKRLSETLGECAWRESGLGAPDDIGDMKQRVITLEQEIAALRLVLETATSMPPARPTGN
jgi:hypothetical protein